MTVGRATVLAACLVGSGAFRAKRKQVAQHASADGSLLVPIDTRKPDETLFPPRHRYPLEPANTEVQGPKHTNKFWGNWVVMDGPNADFPIFPSPYTLKFTDARELYVMKGETDYQGVFFTTHWNPDFVMGAQESFQGLQTVVKEQHFGIHAQVRPAEGFTCTMTYPIFSGMAYASARYEGGCTPRVTTPKLIEKVRAGVWRFQKDHRMSKDYRVYLLTPEGEFVDDSYDFDSAGNLNKQLDGWVRLADVQQARDVEVLDRHARTIVVGWDLEITEGVVQYNFETVGPKDSLLHWAYANHMDFLHSGARLEGGLTKTRSPVKGKMFPLVGGSQWTFKVDLSAALALDFLPAQDPKAEHVDIILAQAQRDYEFFMQYWRLSMHKRDHYFSGKGFQKIAQVCHILAKYRGKNDADVQKCAGIIKTGFQCMYQRNVSDGSDRRLSGPDGEWSQEDGCWWSPFGTWYDLSWGGIPSRWDDSPTCGLDFGNACYNDHHYHWGYYVVTAAMLVDLMPEMAKDTGFVSFINTFIRDVANPSSEDQYFPQFRAFDFFDMHSWSRGLKPEVSGKDQESTSEEVNLHYGMVMWGKVIGDEKIEKLGATILTLASQSLQDYFLMKRDNPNHPASFSINHVTGIFFQNKVHLTTWFGGDPKYIHGIQMLPLTSGLLLSRKDDFCFEEWNDDLASIPINHADPWWSILLSGNLAMHSPEEAWGHLIKMKPEHYDDGLTKSWALYWTSIQRADGPRPTPAPTPAPSAGGPPGAGGPGAGTFCNPSIQPPQYCPSGVQCPQCGAGACLCP